MKQLQDEKDNLALQLNTEKSKYIPVKRRIINPTREEAKELRKQMTSRIMSDNKKKFEQVNKMPVTDDMMTLVGGSSISEDQIKALRVLMVEQFGDSVSQDLKDNFVDFYHREILKARQMGMSLVQSEKDKDGKTQIKASDKFLKVMQDYFHNLA